MAKGTIVQSHFDVIVIGGGAAGMMAATTASAQGLRVLVIEKNKRLGEKLRITGGGRCNTTNATFDLREMLRHYKDAEQFLFSPFSQFGVQDTFNFFEHNGLPLVVQDRNRAFPYTEKANDVALLFERLLTQNSVTVLTNTKILKIHHTTGKIEGIETNNGFYTADAYILATGGVSHPETGSTGDGFTWLTDLGHTIVQPTPSLVPIKTADAWMHRLSGTSLDKCKIVFFCDNQKKFTETGKVLFTHFGLSGPMILNLSHKVQDLLHTGNVTIKIDCFPGIDQSDVERDLIQLFDTNKNKSIKNVLPHIVPSGIARAVLELLDGVVDANTKVHSITKEERRAILGHLKGLPGTITDLAGYETAIVADGGVILNEIDTKTMRSKIISNLFIVGDLLHINRPSGGYSLQLCWTTGYVAGISASLQRD